MKQTTDWKLVIEQLQSVGDMSQPKIAKLCACAQTTISSLGTGATAQPSHALGERLLALLNSLRRRKAANTKRKGLHAAT